MLYNTSVPYKEGDIRYFGHKHHVRFLGKDKSKYPGIRDPYPKAVNHNHPKYVYEILENFITYNGTEFKKDEIVLLPSTLCFGRKNN